MRKYLFSSHIPTYSVINHYALHEAMSFLVDVIPLSYRRGPCKKIFFSGLPHPQGDRAFCSCTCFSGNEAFDWFFFRVPSSSNILILSPKKFKVPFI